MSPCGIILVIFGAFVLIVGLSSCVMFCGAVSVWNIHKMRKYALSIGGILQSRKVGYCTHRFYVVMPDGAEKGIPTSVSKETEWVGI